MEEYVLDLKKEEFLNLLKTCISEQKGIEVDTKSKEDISTTYSPYGNSNVLNIDIYYEESIEVFGRRAVKETKLSTDEILEILNTALEGKDYQVTKIEFLKKLKKVGGVREPEHVPVFDGTKLIVKPKQKVLFYKREG